MNREIHIHIALREWLGRVSTFNQIVAINLVGILGGAIAFQHADVSTHPFWIKALLALSLFDLAGGIVSQFSPLTSAYFAENRWRSVFVLTIQLIHLWIIQFVVAISSIYAFALPALIIGVLLVFVKTEMNKLLIGSGIGVIALIALFSPLVHIAPLGYLFMVLFFIKVLLATPVYWNKLSN